MTPGRGHSTAAYTRLRNQGAEIFALAGSLRHEDGKQIFLRINPEEGPGHAAPEELTDRACERCHALLGAHRKAEAKAVAGRHEMAIQLHVRSEVVGRHQFEGLAADDPDTVERAATEQHLAESRVVHRGGYQPAAAGFHRRLLQHVEELHLFAAPGIGRERLGETAGVLWPGVKGGLRHLQGSENALGQEDTQGLTRHHLDEAAENVGGAAVVPFRAGLADQRQAGDDGSMFGVGDLAAAQPRLLIKLLHRGVAGMVVGDARGVAQQVLDRHRPPQRHQIELAIGVDADLLVGKFRNVFGDGFVEQELAVLEQHHDADRNDRLGHREHAEQAVVGHRRGSRRALVAQCVEPADLAAPGHHHGHARDGALVDIALECIRHALQPGR